MMSRRSRVLAGVIVLLALAFLYTAIAWTMVGMAVVAEREIVDTTPADYGMAYEDIAFSPRATTENPDDSALNLYGWWIPAEAAQTADGETPDASALIVVHGVDSSRVREPETYMPLIKSLRDAGFSLLLFDLRAHGKSDGEIMSAGYFERFDVLGAFDLAQEQYGVEPSRIGVLGFSMGGVTALMAAADEPQLQALVIDSAFANINDLFAAEIANRTPLPEWSVNLLQPAMEISARLRYGIKLSSIKAEETIKAVDFPVLLIHSEDDSRIGVGHSERIAAGATHSDTTLRRFPTGGHSRAFEEHPEEYLEAVTTYLAGRFGAGAE